MHGVKVEVVNVDKVVLDRKDLRTRKCWWRAGCCYGAITLKTPRRKGKKKRKPVKTNQYYTIEVTEDEARTSRGRRCPFCGETRGSYVCDGFPTFQGSVVLSEDDGILKGGA